jgi:hypothetical protein
MSDLSDATVERVAQRLAKYGEPQGNPKGATLLRALRARLTEVERERECMVEVCGMWCEQLPTEVRDVLHAMTDIEKTHNCARLGTAVGRIRPHG